MGAGKRAKTSVRQAATPGSRPLRSLVRDEILKRFEGALLERDGAHGAHCVHELWMRHEPPMVIERMVGLLWRAAPESVPEWLPMRYVEWLPLVYDVASRFQREGRGRHNLYLVLLDYEDSPRGPFGVYVGSSQYTPAERFDQHKAGIRAAGSVLKRGLEMLAGPVLHLQRMKRSQAEEVEERLAEALRAEGLLVRGGH
jgi:hypothetical protein